ncbi:MAG: hypothetical protein V3576_04200 [Candidatus Cloacimonadota bacterium]
MKTSSSLFGRQMLLLVGMSFVLCSCAVPGFFRKAPAPDPVYSSNTPPGASGDAHYIQDDDYFVFHESLGNKSWNQVWIGKMLEAPSAETRNMASFLLVQLNVNELFRYWIKTRIAEGADLVSNKEVIFLNNPDANEIMQAPSGNQQARTMDWVQSRITDMSTLNQGYVTCGNRYKVATSNLRVMQ